MFNFSAGTLKWGCEPFFIDQKLHVESSASQFAFRAKTTSQNIMKVLRAMQLNKAILLEGSPGVGKTSLISALAKATGKLSKLVHSDHK